MEFLIVWLVFLLNGCFGQVVYPGGGSSGRRCVTKAKESGSCKKFLECPAAREDIFKGIYPTICSFGSGGIRNIIVCCRNSDTHVPNVDHFAKFADVCGRVSTVNVLSNNNVSPSFLKTTFFIDQNPKPKETFSRIARQIQNGKPLSFESFKRPTFDLLPSDQEQLPSLQGFIELLREQQVNPSRRKPGATLEVIPSVTYKPAVVGGEDAERNAWPWMALFGRRQTGFDYEWFCGGALITDRHVLSAAHCFITTLKPDVVRFGEHDLSHTRESPHIDVPASAVYRHPRFSSPAVAHDIAIVKLSSPVTFNQYIRPICMPLSDVTPASVGTRGTITGWGTLSFGGRSSDILQEVSVPIVNKQVCETAYKRSGSYDKRFPQGFPDNLFCASEEQGGKDACQGDSGGPFMISDGGRFRVTGVVSAGQGCGSKTYPGLYTWVFPYLQWMQETVAK